MDNTKTHVLTTEELSIVEQIIRVCQVRGAFQIGEAVTVGTLYEKIAKMLGIQVLPTQPNGNPVSNSSTSGNLNNVGNANSVQVKQPGKDMCPPGDPGVQGPSSAPFFPPPSSLPHSKPFNSPWGRPS